MGKHIETVLDFTVSGVMHEEQYIKDAIHDLILFPDIPNRHALPIVRTNSRLLYSYEFQLL